MPAPGAVVGHLQWVHEKLWFIRRDKGMRNGERQEEREGRREGGRIEGMMRGWKR